MKIGEWDDLGQARALLQRQIGELNADEYAAHATVNPDNGRLRVLVATDVGLLDYYAPGRAGPKAPGSCAGSCTDGHRSAACASRPTPSSTRSPTARSRRSGGSLPRIRRSTDGDDRCNGAKAIEATRLRARLPDAHRLSAAQSGTTTASGPPSGSGHCGSIERARLGQDLGDGKVAVPLVVGRDDEPRRRRRSSRAPAHRCRPPGSRPTSRGSPGRRSPTSSPSSGPRAASRTAALLVAADVEVELHDPRRIGASSRLEVVDLPYRSCQTDSGTSSLTRTTSTSS